MWICLTVFAIAAVLVVCRLVFRAHKRKSAAEKEPFREDAALVFNVIDPPSSDGVRPETAEAQFNLGACYFVGEGVARDYAAAAAWWLKAAGQGHAEAMYRLGNCYLDGKGVARDAAEAVKWFRKAAAKNYAVAQYSLGWCCYHGMGGGAEQARGCALV